MQKLAALLILTLIPFGSSPASADQPPGFALAWGSLGTGPGQFVQPAGIACDPQGNVYIADFNNHRVQKFTNTGAFIVQWGTRGSSPGQLEYPTSIAIDATGQVYVTEGTNNRISVFTSDGQFVRLWGSSGTGPGQFAFPVGIAIAPNGDVFITDDNNRRIERFTTSGQFLMEWGSEGSGIGEFLNPSGIVASTTGDIYVMDSGNDRVQVFDQNGTFLYSWGSGGTGPGQFAYGVGLTIDTSGNLYVADLDANRILKFSPTGSLLTMWGEPGYGNGYFLESSSVAADPMNNIFVVDSYRSRIQKFDPTIPPPPPRPAFGGKLLLHVTQPTSKNPCLTGSLSSCADATVSGGLSTASGPFHYAYLLIARGTLPPFNALQCGITYDQNNAAGMSDEQGIDIFSWTLCADREFATPAGFPAGAPNWPAPGSGNLMIWFRDTNCQIGETAVVGYFYLAAYSPDVLKIIPRPVDGKAIVAECLSIAHDLTQSDLGFAAFSANGTDSGCNPCFTNCDNPVAVLRTTWSGIKTLIH